MRRHARARVSFTHIGPKFHGRKSSLATRPRNPSRSDSDEHEEELVTKQPSSQVVGPGNVAKKTGSDRRRYPSCVPHGHVGAGMRALIHRPPPQGAPHSRTLLANVSLIKKLDRSSGRVPCFSHTGSAHDHRVEGHRIRYDDDTIRGPTWFLSYLISRHFIHHR